MKKRNKSCHPIDTHSNARAKKINPLSSQEASSSSQDMTEKSFSDDSDQRKVFPKDQEPGAKIVKGNLHKSMPFLETMEIEGRFGNSGYLEEFQSRQEEKKRLELIDEKRVVKKEEERGTDARMLWLNDASEDNRFYTNTEEFLDDIDPVSRATFRDF